jgi:hypothetical protein
MLLILPMNTKFRFFFFFWVLVTHHEFLLLQKSIDKWFDDKAFQCLFQALRKVGSEAGVKCALRLLHNRNSVSFSQTQASLINYLVSALGDALQEKDSEGVHKIVAPLLECMFEWNQGETVLSLLQFMMLRSLDAEEAESLRTKTLSNAVKSVRKSTTKQKKKGRKPRKQVQENDEDEAQGDSQNNDEKQRLENAFTILETQPEEKSSLLALRVLESLLVRIFDFFLLDRNFESYRSLKFLC